MEILFIEKGKIIKREKRNIHNSNIYLSAQFIQFNKKRYEIQSNLLNIDDKKIELYIKDITI